MEKEQRRNYLSTIQLKQKKSEKSLYPQKQPLLIHKTTGKPAYPQPKCLKVRSLLIIGRGYPHFVDERKAPPFAKKDVD
ncbi:hypothetical protein [Bacillus sp. FJAT-27225]|uniref:hypothetical protein n=1 Tax=Bacillus sp. FJAT-27225 TaxID=1743144 RepID=UPI0011124817|nr:hypothetical protein [Bacillus sp. FJAT-27225]